MAIFAGKNLLTKQRKVYKIQTMWKINIEVPAKNTKYNDFHNVLRIRQNLVLNKIGYNYFPQCI